MYFYTYKIQFVDGFYYHGSRKSTLEPKDDLYFGSPVTHKNKWLETMYDKVILNVYSTEEELRQAEIELIGESYKRDSFCLNESNGRRINFSPEVRQRLCDAHQKRTGYNVGRKLSTNTKEKIRQSLVQYNKENERKPLSQESREKIRQSKVGVCHLTECDKIRMSENHPNSIKITIDGVTYPSLRAASRALNIDTKTIKSRYLK